MKRNLFLTAVLIAFFSNAFNAQTSIFFEDLVVPAEGYYNGSSDYSGSGATETLTYEANDANFYVNYTDDGTYQYWSGFAYSNQTDLETADWTNYSAYSPSGGGASGTSNYVIAYVWADSVMFDNVVDIAFLQVTNSVWDYHYMNGTDGSGTGTYEAGDYFKLTITGIQDDGNYTTPVDFYLADFTNGNSTIIDDWTYIDLNSLGNVKGLKFGLSALDTWTPYYFCMDNITYTNVASIEDNDKSLSIYPNPAKGIVNIENVLNSNILINDISGKTVFTKNNCSENEMVNISNLNSGIYFIRIEDNNRIFTKKLIVE